MQESDREQQEEGGKNLRGAAVIRKSRKRIGRQEPCANTRINIAQAAPQRALCDGTRREVGGMRRKVGFWGRETGIQRGEAHKRKLSQMFCEIAVDI